MTSIDSEFTEVTFAHSSASRGSQPRVTFVPGLRATNSFKSASESPSRPINLRLYKGVLAELSSGALFRADGRKIEESFYMLHKHDINPPSEVGHQFGKDKNYVLSFNSGWRNYYHWTVQCVLSTFLILRSGLDHPHFIFPAVREPVRELLWRVGCVPDAVTFLPKQTNASFEQVWISNASYGDFVLSPTPLLVDFANCIKQSLPYRAEPASEKIYVSRRDSRNRVMQNEADLERLLQRAGFRIVQLSSLSIDEQITLFRDATTIVSPHGAGLTNIIYCRPGTVVHELASDGYPNPCFARIGQMMGLDYSVHIFKGEPSDSHADRTWSVDMRYLANALAS